MIYFRMNSFIPIDSDCGAAETIDLMDDEDNMDLWQNQKKPSMLISNLVHGDVIIYSGHTTYCKMFNSLVELHNWFMCTSALHITLICMFSGSNIDNSQVVAGRNLY